MSMLALDVTASSAGAYLPIAYLIKKIDFCKYYNAPGPAKFYV